MKTAIAIVLVLGILIFFHELGHYLIARAFRIGVRTFSLGFGPRLFGFSRGQTEYRLSLVPLGGYVQLVGESRDAELPEGFTEKDSFIARPPWQRMLVVAAGPIFNLILAWFIYWGLFWSLGQAELLPVIGNVVQDSPAMAADIRPGDRILSINGKEVLRWDDMAEIIRTSDGDALKVKVERGGSTLALKVEPKSEEQKNLFGETVRIYMIGIGPAGEVFAKPLNILQAGIEGLSQTGKVIGLTVLGLKKLVMGAISVRDNLGGPIMIAQLVGEQAEQGISNVLLLTALISINLGLLNLLPIPVLDGGHILFYSIETVIGRPISQRWQQITFRIGLVFLLTLMALAVFNDILRIFRE